MYESIIGAREIYKIPVIFTDISEQDLLQGVGFAAQIKRSKLKILASAENHYFWVPLK